MRLTSWLTLVKGNLSRTTAKKRRNKRASFEVARQAELLQLRTMLSSVSFDFGSGDLAINLDGSDSVTAIVTSEDKVQVSINGSPDDEMPDTSDVYSITVTAGDGGHLIDQSGLQPTDFSYLLLFPTITTGTGHDTVIGTGMMDTIDVGGGNDQVDGNGGDDNIAGGPGNDVMSGGVGWDSIFGGDDDDTLWSGSGVSDGGTSALNGGSGDDLLDGNVEQDPGDDSPPGDTGDDFPAPDLDVDSLNDGTMGSQASDDAEDDKAEWVALNNGDHDADGVPDFAEGLTGDGLTLNSEALVSESVVPAPGTFSAMSLTLPDEVSLAEATVKFEYSASNPGAVSFNSGLYSPEGGGSLVIWGGNLFSDGAITRNVNSIDAGGHWVKNDTEYSPSELGLSEAMNRKASFFIEGVAETGSSSIVVHLDYDSDRTFDASDTVNVSVIQVDVDVDSNKSSSTGLDARTEAEDQLEAVTGKPGKVLGINDGDKDGDGIKDYFDGFSLPGYSQSAANASEFFQPMIVDVPTSVDPAKATVTFSYDDSAPSASPITGGLRICTIGDTHARNGRDVQAGGHFVKSGIEYLLSDSGYTSSSQNVTYYLEGISEHAGSITVTLDPDGDGPSLMSVKDTVNYTVTSGKVITGTVAYGDDDENPVRGAMIAAYSQATGSEHSSATISNVAYTSDSGNYTLIVNGSSSTAHVKVFTRWHSPRSDAPDAGVLRDCKVLETAGQVYKHQKQVTMNSTSIATTNWSGENKINSSTDAGKALWILDDLKTVSEFHSTLPGVDEGVIKARIVSSSPFDYSVAGYYGHNSTTMYIVRPFFRNTHAIYHEYGHHVAYDAGFANQGGGNHSSSLNLTESNSVTPSRANKVAFSKGWVQAFAEFAGNDDFVPNPQGEDNESSVHLALLGLTQSLNTDDVDLVDGISFSGYSVGELYLLLQNEGDGIVTLDQLWDQLTDGASIAEKRAFGHVFAYAEVSPSVCGIREGTSLTTSVAAFAVQADV